MPKNNCTTGAQSHFYAKNRCVVFTGEGNHIVNLQLRGLKRRFNLSLDQQDNTSIKRPQRALGGGPVDKSRVPGFPPPSNNHKNWLYASIKPTTGDLA